ncbi:hypothetical protein [Ruminiclostridium cellobioparum]|jgi:hypothetical protein|uniref:hypothetical protein n=1 Tax=Ruminiclostridium cellobioparum TaxID=29355 RepID=UPI0028A89C75|nr:hypothetical protein [Ruminiclostridium cellobioparum]
MEGKKNVPKGAVIIGDIHTHPNSTAISSNDIKHADYYNYTLYVVVPGTDIRKYSDTRSGKEETVVATNILVKSLSDSQKKALKELYEKQWKDHINDGCDFGCENLKWPAD